LTALDISQWHSTAFNRSSLNCWIQVKK